MPAYGLMLIACRFDHGNQTEIVARISTPARKVVCPAYIMHFFGQK
jgi:hypothetical protein